MCTRFVKYFGIISSAISFLFFSYLSCAPSCVSQCASQKLRTPKPAWSSEQRGVYAWVRLLEKREIVTRFSGPNLIQNIRVPRAYQAIQLGVHNKSNYNYYLDPQKISLPLTDPLALKEKLTLNFSALPVFTALATGVVLVLGVGFAIVPSAIVGMTIGVATAALDTTSVNKSVQKVCYDECLDNKHPTYVPAHHMISKIFFVRKKKMKKNFSFVLARLLSQTGEISDSDDKRAHVSSHELLFNVKI